MTTLNLTYRNSVVPLLLMVLISVGSRAQDIHFSQFYNTPLAINPAQTGFFQGNYRIAAVYRNQWHFLSNPYQTYSAAFDIQLLRNMFNDNNVLSTGLYMYSDQAGKGNLRNTSGQLSLSFQKFFDDGTQSLSIGFQGGLSQIKFNPNDLTFGDQILNNTSSTQENFKSTGITYPDFNAGALWSSIFSDRFTFFAGAALHHLTRPSINFTRQAGNNRLSPRFILHGGSSVKITDLVQLLPSVLYMKQKAANETYFGSAVRYKLNDDFGVRGGSWFRYWNNADAVVAMAGFDFKDFKFEMSYDVNVSSLGEVSKGQGAFEVSLVYIGEIEQKTRRGNIFMPCPRW